MAKPSEFMTIILKGERDPKNTSPVEAIITNIKHGSQLSRRPSGTWLAPARVTIPQVQPDLTLTSSVNLSTSLNL